MTEDSFCDRRDILPFLKMGYPFLSHPRLWGHSTAHRPMDPTIDRSVWGTSTDAFKAHFRQYLKDLAANGDGYRAQLIDRLEWCFDRWDHWRQKFYPQTDSPMLFPFFQSAKGGSEFGHYSICGASGQPSVIHLKRSYLMGTSDVTVWKISPTQKLVLKKDHPNRLRYVDATILHELVHQYLHEGAPAAIRREYEGNESSWYKGHGPLFAAECNRINQILHPEYGFEYVPVRHSKKTHAKVADVQRPSCANFTHGELFWCWDPSNPDLTAEQKEQNRHRLQQALAFYDGAVELVQEAEQQETDFNAPYATDCADVCHQQLLAHDQEKATDLLTAFHLAALKQMQAADTLDQLLAEIGHSTAVLNIPPANGKNGSGAAPAVAVPESGPTVPASGDGERLTLKTAYPISDPVASLKRLNADIEAAGGKAALCQQQFGLKDGSTLSRHLKALQQEISDLVAA